MTYRNLDGAGSRAIARWVLEALAHFRRDPSVVRVEWKTRGHDHAPGLHDALLRSGFEPEEEESIMIGRVASLISAVPLPPGVTLRKVAGEGGMELWVAEHQGLIVSAGRLEPVPGTDFAGIWGGATREEWRSQGIYRAVTAARARSAVKLGKKFIHSDSTSYSRPILERYGFLRVSTTTPYCWRR
ncbi:GNAT family N-acetyltransferase [Arthrobacter sp. CC3]|uniref:GNAT family N-acetyltransferase n=1 Tax=Arthrobacter sp. CC3 TaxID=3029185 RepID=UPI0032640823